MNRVPNYGPRDAKIAFVGEAPGKDELALGRPFVGYSGTLLRECISGVGIDPDACWYGNLCKYRPPGNELRAFFDRKGIPNSQVMEGLSELQADLAEIQPNVIVPLGNFPLKFLTGRGRWKPDKGFTGIGDFRSYFFSGTPLAGGRKCLPTYHPAAASRDYSLKHLILFDLGKVARQQHDAALHYTPRRIIIDPRGFEKEAWSAWLTSPVGTPSPAFNFPDDIDVLPRSVPAGEFLTGDIEYIGARLLCFGFTRNSNVAVVFATRDAADIRHVRDVASSGIPLCFQNGMFDGSILDWHLDIPLWRHFRHDTMNMMHAAYTEFPKDLGFIGSLHTDQHCWWEHVDDAFWKGVRDGSRSVDECFEYNGFDVCVTHEAAEKMLVDELLDPEILSNYKFKMDLVQSLWPISKRGVAIDRPAIEVLRTTLTTEAELISAGISMKFMSGVEFNVKSGNDVADLLYTKLSMAPGPRTEPSSRFPQGQWKLDDTTLADLSLKAKNDSQRLAIRMVRDARERRDLISKFCDIELDDDGRMRCHYDPAKTTTDRLSSRSFYPTDRGANLQNVPRDTRVRAVFVPDPGYIFGYADLKSAESLVVAHITGDPEMLRLHSPEYMDGSKDGHKYVASFLLDKPIDRITKDDRYLGKKVRHAGNYGLSWFKLMQFVNADAQKTGVSIDAARAKSLITKYRQLHQFLPAWWSAVERELWETHSIHSQHRRKRIFYGRPSEILPEAIAYNPQCTVAQTLNMGLSRIDPRYVGTELTWMKEWDLSHYPLLQVAQFSENCANLHLWGVEMLLQVHDAIGFQIPIDNAEIALPLIRDLMAIPIPIKRRGLEPYEITIPVEIQIGYNWGESDEDPKQPGSGKDKDGKPAKNPRGLKSWHEPEHLGSKAILV